MEDKKILVTRAYLPPMEEYIEELKELWESHWITNMGEKHRKLQQELMQFMGADAIELFTKDVYKRQPFGTLRRGRLH